MNPFVKIVTINTWKGEGDYHRRLKVMALQLKALKPHVIVCQECLLIPDEKINTVGFLAGELGMDYACTPARPKKRQFQGHWLDSFSGLGILSGFPLAAIMDFDLPSTPEDGGRVAQQVAVKLPSDEELLLTNVHLTHLSHASELRKSQVETVVSQVVNKHYRYRLIGGDLNATPASEEVRLLKTLAQAADCYELGNGPEPRVSLLNTLQQPIPACVDYLFTLPLPDTKKYPTFIHSSTVLHVPDEENGLHPSDHFGIASTLVLEGGSQRKDVGKMKSGGDWYDKSVSFIANH